MNSQFFSIDSIIGVKPKSEGDKESEHKGDKHTHLEINEGKQTEDSPKYNSSNVHHRRLKVPSYHTSTRDSEEHVMHESTSTGSCHSSTCTSPHISDNNTKYEDHRGSPGQTCSNSCKALPKQKRLSLTKHQLGELEKCFLKNYYPTEATREDLAMRLGLSHARVKVWFQNRRAKWQRNQKMKSEWQSFLHNPFTTALGLSHHRLMLQQHHQLLGDTHCKEYNSQCIQTPMPSLFSPFPHSNMAFMLPRQDLMSYAIGKPSMQAIDAYMMAKQAAEHENTVKMCLSDESDSEETSKSAPTTHSPGVTNANSSSMNLAEKPVGLPPGQFWW